MDGKQAGDVRMEKINLERSRAAREWQLARMAVGVNWQLDVAFRRTAICAALGPKLTSRE
eukprot:5091456-Pleurochrysis_carterae.AAC.1